MAKIAEILEDANHYYHNLQRQNNVTVYLHKTYMNVFDSVPFPSVPCVTYLY